MAWHLLALLAVIAWTGITTILVLLPLLLCGKLKIIDADERTGMDVKKIKEQSYHGSHPGQCHCHLKSTADPLPMIIVPGNKRKMPICGSVNTAKPAVAESSLESRLDGAVSFPLPSPSSKSLSTELDSKVPPLLSSIPTVDSFPYDMEEVTPQINAL